MNIVSLVFPFGIFRKLRSTFLKIPLVKKMKKKQLFANADDVRHRLGGSIIRFMGKPVYVRDTDKFTINGFFLDNVGRAFSAEVDDENLDFSSPPLGYVNTETYCGFVSRIPARRFTQGLNA